MCFIRYLNTLESFKKTRLCLVFQPTSHCLVACECRCISGCHFSPPSEKRQLEIRLRSQAKCLYVFDILHALTCCSCSYSRIHEYHMVLTDSFWKPMIMKLQETWQTTMTYNVLNEMAPSYISALLQLHYPLRSLRSASNGLTLQQPDY